MSGLVTAQDLMAQLKGRQLGERLLIPCNMLKADEDIFLDDFSVRDVENALQIPVHVVKSGGRDLLEAMVA